MDIGNPFTPCASTFLVAANTTASAAVQTPPTLTGSVNFEFFNSGTDDAYIGYGSTGAAALANAVIPTVGNPTQCLLVPARSGVIYTLTGGMWLSGIVATTQSNVYVTPGAGS